MSKVMTLMNDLIELISMGPFGSDITVDNFVNDGVPVLNGSNVSSIKLIETSFKYVTPEKSKALKKANAKRGDIVITHRGTVGQISYIPENSKYDNYVISQSQFRVSLKRDLVDPIYFTYYFHTNEGQKRLLSFKSHVGVPALAQATTNFRLLEFPLISLAEQQKIAKVLSDLDAKIELNNKINSELEAMAKTLYDYWFVQFDFPAKLPSTSLRLTSSDIDAVSLSEVEVPYKSSGGKMVYNQELKREIPEGWEINSLSSLVDCNKWTIKKNNSFTEINYLDTSSLTNNVIDGIQKITCETEKVPSRAQRVISKNDILYSTVRPNQCHFGIIKNPMPNMIASTGFAQLRSKSKFISNELIYTFLSSKIVTTRLQQIADTAVSAYPSISHYDILELKIALPQENRILLKTNSLLEDVYMKISLNQKENQQLTSLRDWLLPMLMNGQITVKGAEEALDMVAENSADYQKR